MNTGITKHKLYVINFNKSKTMFQLFKNTAISKISRYHKLLQQTKSAYLQINKLPDQELQQQTHILKEQLNQGYSLDDLLPKAFAVVKEATRRVLQLEMFDVQILGGIALHYAKIAEMKTGEGKTIVSILPAYLNSLKNPGVHIVTVNDYLAKRDAEWVGEVYKFLHLTVGLIQQKMNNSERRQNYSCDIVYLTNSELGFDYLRDNMAIEPTSVVQNNLSYAIIDEVDSILIDEARTPLIISGQSNIQSTKYKEATILSKKLKKILHYEIDEKNRNIILTDSGILFCEQFLKTNNLYNIKNPWAQYIINALKAKELFLKNRHYIVKQSEIIIVDEFTGRLMSGRRWSDGLHQAIESKENLTIQKENKTLASITYQNLFLLYKKLSGMTGTAKTEETELDKIYNLEVITVPTHKPCVRKDFFDLVYKTEFGKWQAITQECCTMNQKGRPVLVGTTNIEKSEMLAEMLNAYRLRYNLLNAKPKNVYREAEIIAQAGRKYALTISTNMAGRGTDIILGGNALSIAKFIFSYLIKKELFNLKLIDNYPKYDGNTEYKITKKIQAILQHNIALQNINVDNLNTYINDIVNLTQKVSNRNEPLRNLYLDIVNYYKTLFHQERQEVIQLGGLHVIGTERHESRRIDNQLRGRAGRQGDPGSSRFFLSLDDHLLKIFGGEKVKALMNNLQIDEYTPIESTILSKSLDTAQKKVELYFYDIRKQLFEYDAVINTQRQAIYAERKKILESPFMRNCIIEYGESTIDELLLFHKNEKNAQDAIFMQISKLLNLPSCILTEQYKTIDYTNLKRLMHEQLHAAYDLKEAYLEELKPGLIRQLEKYYLLEQIDQGWQNHIEKMSFLRESINWRSYGQQDPLIEYKNEAFNLFLNMTRYIRQTVIYLIMRSRLIVNPK